MNFYNESIQREAENAYKKFIKSSKGLFGIIKQKDGLESFKNIQREEQAYNSSFLGIREVKLENIVGSVEKYKDFHKNFIPKNNLIKERWVKIYAACIKEEMLPPVILYKIKGNYYVYDGNHRVSVAKFLNYLTIEAEVTEFIPSGEEAEDIIYREKFIFEKESGIQDIVFTETGQYKRLTKEIEWYKNFLKEKKSLSLTYKEASQYWYRDIFKNICSILEVNLLTKYAENFNINDLFIEVLDHKYFLNREKQGECGYLYSVVDFINMVKTSQNISLDNKCAVPEIKMENFLKLQKIDKGAKISSEKVKINDIFEKMIHIDFCYDDFSYEMIENFRQRSKIKDITEVIKKWFGEVYLPVMKYFFTKLKKLPEKYSKNIKPTDENNRIFFKSIYVFSKLYYDKKDRNFSSKMENIIEDYITELYINIMNSINKNRVSSAEVMQIYVKTQKQYFQLIRNKKLLNQEQKVSVYSVMNAENGFFTHNKFNKKNKINNIMTLLIKKRYTEFLKNFKSRKNMEKFQNIYYLYSGIGLYSTFIKLEKVMMLTGEKEFIYELEKNIEILKNTGYIVKNYKTLEVLRDLNEENENMSFLDFYTKIIDYGMEISTEFLYLNILDIALDYLSNCQNIELCINKYN